MQNWWDNDPVVGRQQPDLGRPVIRSNPQPAPQTPAQQRRDSNAAAASDLDPATAAADLELKRQQQRKNALDIERMEKLAKDPTGALSVEQSKAAGFYSRAAKANEAYEKMGVGPEAGLTSLGKAILPDSVQGYVLPDKRIEADANIRSFISSVLRYESGAVIGDPEFQNAYKNYFPLPGEGPDVVTAKKRLRQEAMEALRIGSGPGGGMIKPSQPRAANVSGVYGIGAPKPLEVDIHGYDRLPGESDADYMARSERLDAERNRPPDISDARGKGGFLEGADAFMRNAASVPTFGTSDKIAAAADTIFRGGTMDENLKRQYAITDYDAANHTGAGLGGMLAGGFLLPLGEMKSLPQVAGKSAAVGGAYGLGSSRNWSDVPGNVAGGAAVGGGIGAGFVGAARGLRALKEMRAPHVSELPPLVDPATGRLNEPLQSARPSERMAAAKAFGIDLPLDAAGDRGMAIIGRSLDNLPASAGIMNDGRRVAEGQVNAAVENVANRYGAAKSPHDIGQAVQTGTKNWMTRFDATVEKAYNAIPISDKAQTSLGNTRAVLNELTSAFESNPELASTLKNAQIEQYQSALQSGSLSWKDLKAFRTIIGDQIGGQRFSDSPTKKQLQALYGALSEDMKATAGAMGPQALRAFERANGIKAQGEQRIEQALVSFLGDDAMKNPEAAASAIRNITTSGKASSNIKQLQQLRASMMKGGEWDDVAGGFVRLMGQPAGSQGRAFDPEVFVRNYADMSEPARNLLFGGGNRQELRKALDAFVSVNQRLVGTKALRNTSQTAPNLIGGGGLLAMFHALGTGDVRQAAGLAAAGGVNYGAGKLWTNPAFVRWATGYSRAVASQNQNSVRRQIGRLGRVAIKNPSLRGEIEQFGQSLLRGANDNFTHGAAASDPNQNDQRQRY